MDMDNNMEIEQGQQEVRAPFFQRLFASTAWKKLLDIKEFLLALWMLFDIILDCFASYGYYYRYKITKQVLF